MTNMPASDYLQKTIPLIDLSPGMKGTIAAVPENPLMYPLGLRPGKDILCKGCQLFGGPLLVKVDDRQIALSRLLAEKIIVIL